MIKCLDIQMVVHCLQVVLSIQCIDLIQILKELQIVFRVFGQHVCSHAVHIKIIL